MRDAGLLIPDERIGWYTSAQLDLLEKKQDARFLSDFIHKQLPGCSALVCQNDEIAYWMINELSYAGLEVPQDITVVCFTDSYLSSLIDAVQENKRYVPAVQLLIVIQIGIWQGAFTGFDDQTPGRAAADLLQEFPFLCHLIVCGVHLQ